MGSKGVTEPCGDKSRIFGLQLLIVSFLRSPPSHGHIGVGVQAQLTNVFFRPLCLGVNSPKFTPPPPPPFYIWSVFSRPSWGVILRGGGCMESQAYMENSMTEGINVSQMQLCAHFAGTVYSYKGSYILILLKGW